MKPGLLAGALTVMLLASGCSSSPRHAHEDSAKRDNPAKAIIQAMGGAGQVSWQENQRYFEKLFLRLDVNHDGFVSEEEFKAIDNDPLFKAMPLQKLEISFAMFDRNDAHKLSRDEFEHFGDRVFTLLDRNMDGVISESDFAADSACSHDPDGQSGGKGRHGGMGGSSNGGF